MNNSISCLSRSSLYVLLGHIRVYSEDPDCEYVIMCEIQRRIDLLSKHHMLLGGNVRRMYYSPHLHKSRPLSLPPRYNQDPEGWLRLAEFVAAGHYTAVYFVRNWA